MSNSRSDAQRLLDQNPADVSEQDCSHRDDPGHDHEQCLEMAAANRALVDDTEAVTGR